MSKPEEEKKQKERAAVEYKIVRLNLVEADLGTMNTEQLEEAANLLGAEGWVLNAIHQGRIAVFMRPKL